MTSKGRRDRALILFGIVAWTGCSTTPSLDMSSGTIEPPRHEIGIVIGSVLVQTEEVPPDSWLTRLFGRKASGFDYDFEIVSVPDPASIQKTDTRYTLEVKPGEERIFVARLPFGRYVINRFRYKGISLLAGEMGANFVVAPRATLYIGRFVLKVQRRVSLGTPYDVEVQDAREATIAALQPQHPGLGLDAMTALIQERAESVRERAGE
jgi:hypothetical protein